MINYSIQYADLIEDAFLTIGTRLSDNDFTNRIENPEKVLFNAPLYGDTADIHDDITGAPGSFTNIISLINNPHLNIGIHTLLLKKNIERIERIKEISVRHARNINFVVLYLSDDESKYMENTPMLSDIADRIKNILTDEEYFHFVDHNRMTFPACVSGVKSEHKPSETVCSDIKGSIAIDYLWGERADSAFHCVHRKSCSQSNSCPGIYKAYTEVYGWDEIRPV